MVRPNFPDRPVVCELEQLEERLCLSHSGLTTTSGSGSTDIAAIVAQLGHRKHRHHNFNQLAFPNSRTTDSLGNLLMVGTVPGTPSTNSRVGTSKLFADNIVAAATINVANFQPVGLPSFPSVDGSLTGASFSTFGSFCSGAFFVTTF